MNLLRWLIFLLGTLTVTFTVLFFWIYFSYNPNIGSTMGLIMLLSWFPLAFLEIKKGLPHLSSHSFYGYSCPDWDQLQDKNVP